MSPCEVNKISLLFFLWKFDTKLMASRHKELRLMALKFGQVLTLTEVCLSCLSLKCFCPSFPVPFHIYIGKNDADFLVFKQYLIVTLILTISVSFVSYKLFFLGYLLDVICDYHINYYCLCSVSSDHCSTNVRSMGRHLDGNGLQTPQIC